jgi:hypothetical protein
MRDIDSILQQVQPVQHHLAPHQQRRAPHVP